MDENRRDGREVEVSSLETTENGPREVVEGRLSEKG